MALWAPLDTLTYRHLFRPGEKLAYFALERSLRPLLFALGGAGSAHPLDVHLYRAGHAYPAAESALRAKEAAARRVL